MTFVFRWELVASAALNERVSHAFQHVHSSSLTAIPGIKAGLTPRSGFGQNS